MYLIFNCINCIGIRIAVVGSVKVSIVWFDRNFWKMEDIKDKGGEGDYSYYT